MCVCIVCVPWEVILWCAIGTTGTKKFLFTCFPLYPSLSLCCVCFILEKAKIQEPPRIYYVVVFFLRMLALIVVAVVDSVCRYSYLLWFYFKILVVSHCRVTFKMAFHLYFVSFFLMEKEKKSGSRWLSTLAFIFDTTMNARFRDQQWPVCEKNNNFHRLTESVILEGEYKNG